MKIVEAWAEGYSETRSHTEKLVALIGAVTDHTHRLRVIGCEGCHAEAVLNRYARMREHRS